LQKLAAEIAAGMRGAPWALADGMVMFNGRLFVPSNFPLRHAILTAAHDDAPDGVQKTLHRLRRDFHIPDGRAAILDYVKACVVCQRNKTEHMHPAGLLQPLPIPTAVWSDISMDFVEGLPKVGGKSMILTVVDRFSKYAHFVALSHPYTAVSVARIIFDEIVRLHGIPTSIVSDRDPVFTSAFWQELFRASGSKLHMNSAFHPQSDGQTEVVNKIIAMYLRCLTRDRPRQWVKWLPWAEYVYNTSFQSAVRETPFKIVYGRDPPCIRSYEPGELRVAAVAQNMAEHQEFLDDVRLRLEQASAVSKQHYDRRHRQVSF